MIDVENIVFNHVATSLRSTYSGIFVSGENVPAPSSFPAVTLVEMDNSVYTRSIDSSSNENHATLMYQAEVYSKLISGRKAEAKKIMASLDTLMLAQGFIRISNTPIPNSDQSIYRLVARYRTVVDKNNLTYHK